jgi:putative FmdB family regulatory protein
MPLYEYCCNKCGVVELLRKMSDKSDAFCPTCGLKIERIISNTSNPKFKGSGFYETDYRKKT